MADRHTLDLARQWAADINADRRTLSQDTIDAAADLITSLPDEWVDADDLREYVAEWRAGLATAPRGNYEAEMLDDLEDMLPAPPAPRTMDEIEWDDAEHHLAEALFGDTRKVVMLARDTDEEGDWSEWIHCRMEDGSTDLIEKEYLTPTGRKYRMEPEDDVAYATGGALTAQDVVDECRAVRKERAASESASPRPEDVPEFDPAYTYLDRDGREWEHLDGRWITGTTHAERVTAREDSPGRASLPDAFAPYRKGRLSTPDDHR